MLSTTINNYQTTGWKVDHFVMDVLNPMNEPSGHFHTTENGKIRHWVSPQEIQQDVHSTIFQLFSLKTSEPELDWDSNSVYQIIKNLGEERNNLNDTMMKSSSKSQLCCIQDK